MTSKTLFNFSTHLLAHACNFMQLPRKHQGTKKTHQKTSKLQDSTPSALIFLYKLPLNPLFPPLLALTSALASNKSRSTGRSWSAWVTGGEHLSHLSQCQCHHSSLSDQHHHVSPQQPQQPIFTPPVHRLAPHGAMEHRHRCQRRWHCEAPVTEAATGAQPDAATNTVGSMGQ